MSNEPLKQDIPGEEQSPEDTGGSRIGLLWEQISQMGVGEPVLRAGSIILTLTLIAVVGFAMRGIFAGAQPTQADMLATAQAIAEPTIQASGGGFMPAYSLPEDPFSEGIPRLAKLDTTIPDRPRVDVTTYTVEVGDSVFSIAAQFSLEPETILWGNYDALQDNPLLIKPGQVFNILPVNGVYYRYNVGETLASIADFFEVDPQAIVEFPGNDLDPYETDIDNPGIADGTWLIIPGGRRELQDWGPPAITRQNPASAAYYGAGHCGDIYEGPIGSGTFVWPTVSHDTSTGNPYDPDVHPAIDIAGSEGMAIFATDSGVVVYAGWSDYGYGYLIVIDHGNGWQSAYAHLSGVGVICGQGVFQGSQIGAMGTTGNSTGPHLHFELTSSVYGKVNPLNYLIP